MHILERELVEKIHATPTKAVIIATGGGLQAFGELTYRGGGSATLLSGFIPYDQEESYELLGGKPDKLVSEEATCMMAMVAYKRALKLAKGQYPVIGIASSSVLQRTPDERSGRVHYIYAALQTDTTTTSLVLKIENASDLAGTNDALSIRPIEERVNSHMILNLIAEGCGLDERIELGETDDMTDLWLPNRFAYEKHVVRTSVSFPGMSISSILNGTPVAIDCYPGNVFKIVENPLTVAQVILPGSFRPVQAGHWEMAEITQKHLDHVVDFEISIVNAAKPTIDLIALKKRLEGFSLPTLRKGIFDSVAIPVRVWVTNAPTFVQKSDMFKATTFVVGYDTAVRICDPKYAGDLEILMPIFLRNKTNFMVFGREQEGVYHSGLDQFPPEFQSIAIANVERHANAAVSSSEIRRQQSQY